MYITDAQVHIWEPPRPDRPADPVRQPHGEPFLAEHLIQAMDEGGIDRAVLVVPAWAGYYNDYSLEAAQRWPDRIGVMGRFDPTTPDAPSRLPGWLDQPGMLGIRFVLAYDPWRRWLDDGTLDWFWPRAEELGIPVAVYTFGIPDPLRKVAARYRGLKLLIDHLALPLPDVADPFATLDETLALAQYPNVYAKLTALPVYTKEPYPFRDLHPIVRRVCDAFGPERVLWGTDVTRLPCSYRDAVNLIAEACDFLSEKDRAWILGGAAAKALDWPISAGRSPRTR